MASTPDYYEYIKEQLSCIEEISYRKMMGEYVIYYKNKVIGGIYDNRFLLKITKSSELLLPDAEQEIPYESAKPMLMTDKIEEPYFLKTVFEKMYGELPEKKTKR